VSSSKLRPYLELPRAVHILCLGALVNRAGTMLIPFLTLYLRSELGYSVSQATSIVASYGVGALLAAVLGGYAADRLGRRRVMLVALVGGAVLLGLWSLARGPVPPLLFAFSSALVLDLRRHPKRCD